MWRPVQVLQSRFQSILESYIVQKMPDLWGDFWASVPLSLRFWGDMFNWSLQGCIISITLETCEMCPPRHFRDISETSGNSSLQLARYSLVNDPLPISFHFSGKFWPQLQKQSEQLTSQSASVAKPGTDVVKQYFGQKNMAELLSSNVEVKL